MKKRETMAINHYLSEYSDQASSIDDLFENYSESIVPAEIYEDFYIRSAEKKFNKRIFWLSVCFFRMVSFFKKYNPFGW